MVDAFLLSGQLCCGGQPFAHDLLIMTVLVSASLACFHRDDEGMMLTS